MVGKPFVTWRSACSTTNIQLSYKNLNLIICHTNKAAERTLDDGDGDGGGDGVGLGRCKSWSVGLGSGWGRSPKATAFAIHIRIRRRICSLKTSAAAMSTTIYGGRFFFI